MSRVKAKPAWKHIGDNYHQLEPNRCYIGTRVLIVPYSGGKYAIRLMNDVDTPMTDEELSRKKGSCDSNKTWKSVSGAKRVAYAIARRFDWLTAAGIVFKKEGV